MVNKNVCVVGQGWEEENFLKSFCNKISNSYSHFCENGRVIGIKRQTKSKHKQGNENQFHNALYVTFFFYLKLKSSFNKERSFENQRQKCCLES